MTYIQLVNQVLVRLREEQVATLVGEDDNVVLLVASLVNDARRRVSDAHTWNAYRETWIEPTTTGVATISLTDAGKYATIESVYSDEGHSLRLRSLADIRRLAAEGGDSGDPYFYSPDGLDASGDLRLRLSPTPDAAKNLTVYGYKQPVDLVGDDDVCNLPPTAVFSLAYAMAAAERGESGGQPVAELYAHASNTLSDAIALDASLNTLDDVWYS